MTSKLDFPARLERADTKALNAGPVRTLMLNIGRRCDLACAHCHHRCSPFAVEQMSREVMNESLELACVLGVELVDVTGGSPELWPHLSELAAKASDRDLPLRVRTNLVPLGRPGGERLIEVFAENNVRLLASVPEAGPAQRSALRPGHAAARLRAIERLKDAGYGKGNGHLFELAVNPEQGLPRPEEELAPLLVGALDPLGVHPDRVLSIANVPLGRFGDRLESRGERKAYLHRLVDAFDERALPCLPCRTGLTVCWNGVLYDCDFNLSAGLPLRSGPARVHDALEDPNALIGRPIAFASHCFACTVGSGSG